MFFKLLIGMLISSSAFASDSVGKTVVKIYGNFSIDAPEANGCATFPKVVASVEETIVDPSDGTRKAYFSALGYTIAQARAAYRARLAHPERIGRPGEFMEDVKTTAVEANAHTILTRTKRERCAPPRAVPKSFQEKMKG